MRIIVIGAGEVGYHIAERLSHEAHDIVVIERSPEVARRVQEGLRLPCVKIAESDQLVESIVEIIRENVRLPDMAIGDLHAQLATVRIADLRLQ